MSLSKGFVPPAASTQRTPVGSQYRRNNYRKCDRSRRSWSDREEEALIVVLKDLVATGWKCDNGFRSGYLKKIEDWLRKEFPTTDLREQPHIYSKLSTWKKFYYSLRNILERSGVGFNDHGDFKIDCSDDQWDQIVKQDKNARCMRNKSWPYLEDWKMIFGKDRATGSTSEYVGQAANNSIHEEHVADTDGLSDMNTSFDDVLAEDPVQATGGTEHGGDSAQSQKKGEPSNRYKRKRKGRDDDGGLLELLGKLHAETNSRLETLSMRIGYEMDLGKARQNVFNQLGSMTSLSEELRYDICEIMGKDNSRLEIFMGLPEPSKPGYVMRILKKERLI